MKMADITLLCKLFTQTDKQIAMYKYEGHFFLLSVKASDIPHTSNCCMMGRHNS